MVDYAITIANNLIVVGYNPTSAWGTLTWGTDSWRFNGETLQDVDKLIDFGSATPADAMIKDIEHLLDFGSTLLSETITKGFERSYNNSIAASSNYIDMYLTDANGYYHVFKGGVIDADDRIDADWTLASSTSQTWTPVTAIDSTWS